MRTRAVLLWLTLVGCLILGNLAAGLAYWHRAGLAQAVATPSPPELRPQPLPALPVVEEKLPGDVLLVAIDNRFLRAHSNDWVEQLASLQADLDRRLLGGGVQLVDRQQVQAWQPSRPLPPESAVLADADFEGTFARAFQVIEDFGRKARTPDFKTFLIWLDDVNPDRTPRTGSLARPRRWVMLLWHGRPGTSRRLSEVVGDDWIVRFKQDTTGLRSSVLYYARRE